MTDVTRTTLSGTALTVEGNDIDTDRIIPARYLRAVTFEGLGVHAFEDDRRQLTAAGQTHPFDDPTRQGAEVLVVGRNFGCGSSREHAPQALMRWASGIKAIVGESFSEIFFGNCVSLGIPCVTGSPSDLHKLASAVNKDATLVVTVDLVALEVRFGSERIPAPMPAGALSQLRSGGWDSMSDLLGGQEALKRVVANLPYFGGWA